MMNRKSYDVFHLRLFPLTLSDPKRSNRGHAYFRSPVSPKKCMIQKYVKCMIQSCISQKVHDSWLLLTMNSHILPDTTLSHRSIRGKWDGGGYLTVR